jgi:hypothetical protein
MNPPDYPVKCPKIYSQKFFSFTHVRNISVPDSVCVSALGGLTFENSGLDEIAFCTITRAWQEYIKSVSVT